MCKLNNKGFTLIELLTTLIILGLVIGLTITTMNVNVEKTAEKTEEIFVDTLRDAIDMYVTSNLGRLGSNKTMCVNKLRKGRKGNGLEDGGDYRDIDVYEIKKNDGSYITFNDIIGDSNNNVLTDKEFVNPANEGKDRFNCEKDAVIKLYRDDDFVYYYYVEKSGLDCLNNINDEYGMVISNLPLVGGDYYTCS